MLYSKQATKDSKKIELSNLKSTVKHLIEIITNNPFENHSPYEKLVGDLTGKYSRRINIQHRLIYEVFEKEHIVHYYHYWTAIPDAARRLMGDHFDLFSKVVDEAYAKLGTHCCSNSELFACMQHALAQE